jgi:hypothetical protein
MDASKLIHRFCPSMDRLAQEAGLSHDYVKHLAKPNNPRTAGPLARLKLARAFRRHAERLMQDAEVLEGLE